MLWLRILSSMKMIVQAPWVATLLQLQPVTETAAGPCTGGRVSAGKGSGKTFAMQHQTLTAPRMIIKQPPSGCTVSYVRVLPLSFSKRGENNILSICTHMVLRSQPWIARKMQIPFSYLGDACTQPFSRTFLHRPYRTLRRKPYRSFVCKAPQIPARGGVTPVMALNSGCDQVLTQADIPPRLQWRKDMPYTYLAAFVM